MGKEEETIFNFSKKFCDYCIKMESQKIINLLENTNEYDLKYATKNGTLLMIKIMGSIELIQLLNSIQKV